MVQITAQYGTVDLEGGEYRFYNNVWGASTPQFVTVNTDSTYFKIDSTKHNLPSNGAPASYPFILKGSHFNGTPTSVNNPFPLAVKSIKSCPTTWEIGGTNAPGIWDCAYDIWFVQNGSNKLEMMIWINYQGPQPAGSLVTTTNIDSISWQVWWNKSSTLSYRITTKRDTCNFDLKLFMNDAVKRGYLDSAWALGAVEVGFEIWQNGAGLTSELFSVTATTITEVNDLINDKPSSFGLGQNYPNPFNPTTVIDYQLPVSSHVTLKIYDVLGREVATLVNKNEIAGYRSVTFDGSKLSSGVYFYRLEAGMYHDTKELLLLK